MLLDCLVFLGWTTFTLLFFGMALSTSRGLRWALSFFDLPQIIRFAIRAGIVLLIAMYFAHVFTDKIGEEAGLVVRWSMLIGFIVEYAVLAIVPFGRPDAIELVEPYEREPIMCTTTSVDAREYRPGDIGHRVI